MPRAAVDSHAVIHHYRVAITCINKGGSTPRCTPPIQARFGRSAWGTCSLDDTDEGRYGTSGLNQCPAATWRAANGAQTPCGSCHAGARLMVQRGHQPLDNARVIKTSHKLASGPFGADLGVNDNLKTISNAGRCQEGGLLQLPIPSIQPPG
jgi:hypothetical protein